MRTWSLTLAAAAGVAALSVGALQAQQGARPGQVDVAKVESGNYATDPSHSMVGFSINHLGFNDYFGIFGDVTGTLSVDAANPANSKVDVTIPVAGVTVPSAGLKAHLLSPGKDGGKPDFFGPAPAAAHFVSTAVKTTGATTADITGDLTLNGVTKPVTIKAQLAGMGANMMSKKATLGFHGTTTIKRSEFNVPFGIQFGISDEVPLNITVAFEKQ